MTAAGRLNVLLALGCWVGIFRIVECSSGQYNPEQSAMRTCPRASFPATNYVYKVPAESVWDIAAAKHAAVSQEPAHATIVAYVSDEDPWSASMRSSTLACLHRFYRARDLVFVVVHYKEMSLNEQMQQRIGNLPAFRIFSQGRRYVADGQQSLEGLIGTIEARTGVSPVGPVDRLQLAEWRDWLGCRPEVDEVDAEDFKRAGQKGPWLYLSAVSLVLLAMKKVISPRLKSMARSGEADAGAQHDNAAAVAPLAGGRVDG